MSVAFNLNHKTIQGRAELRCHLSACWLRTHVQPLYSNALVCQFTASVQPSVLQRLQCNLNTAGPFSRHTAQCSSDKIGLYFY